MGRRQRQRAMAAGSPGAFEALKPTEYTDAEGNTLTLRASLSPASRRRYGELLAGSPLSREDAWQQAVEFLFGHLAVRWVLADLPLRRPGELMGRYRAASTEERAWIRAVMREHCAEHFPELRAP